MGDVGRLTVTLQWRANPSLVRAGMYYRQHNWIQQRAVILNALKVTL